MGHKEDQASARALKKARREEHERIALEKTMTKEFIPHPEGTLNDGMGRYYFEGKRLVPECHRIIGHSQEGFVILK